MRAWLLLAAVFLTAAAPTGAAPPARRGQPVTLASRPGTTLDAAARKLMAQDLNEARQARDRVLVLTGSATLGPASDRAALFVQLQSARECGSAGCSTSVYLWQGGAWKLVLDGVGGALTAGPGRSKGMLDLATGRDRFVWNGSQYVDANPAPAVDLRPRSRRP